MFFAYTSCILSCIAWAFQHLEATAAEIWVVHTTTNWSWKDRPGMKSDVGILWLLFAVSLYLLACLLSLVAASYVG